VADIFGKVPNYGLMHGWLGPEAVERLLRFAQSNEHCFEAARVYDGEADKINHSRRVSRKLRQSILAHEHSLKNDLKTHVADLLPVMFDRLTIRPFTPSRIEVEFVVHSDGAFFERHVDNTQASRHRVISAVYYFHVLPKAFAGGALRLHSLAASGERGTFIDVEPEYDTLVFFPSFFPHEVLSVACPSGQFMGSRFAINFWIHRGSS
jgi:Rps23 Pro-64 3,4-dihydroxylase Tpa1-like proline 4-hydroxylase